MQLAKVVGNLVATHKNKKLIGKKLLFIQPIDENLVPFGNEMIAVDGVGAGVGDIVVILNEGNSARQVTNATDKYAPIELAVAGIVDSIKTKNDYKTFE
ncbi:MAG: EutN/CcmL family microcompartment protein, partial [Cyclobacteriaceae bacterium]|nr:EutN/CcmL family microcompartment protein [Cyclobacteriaceae bacterium]